MKSILILLFLPLKIFCQDISGVWTGSLYNDTTKSFIAYELVISEEKGNLSGYSHTTFIIDGIPNIGVKKIKIIRKKDNIFIEDVELIYNNYSVSPAKGVHQFSLLRLSSHDSIMVLSGSWKTNRTRDYSPATGKLSLQKKNRIDDSKLIVQLEKMGLMHELSFIERPIESKPSIKTLPVVLRPAVVKNTAPAAELNSRNIETIETVFFNSDSLILTLYDNGEVDGDTVTVLMNGKVIWPQQMLTEKGINKTIHIPPDLDSIQLIMYAENLGSIPPNTGLLVVRDGSKDYEIRFSGDLQKNAEIVLKRRKIINNKKENLP